MRGSIWLIAVVVLVAAVGTYAQDPGLPDSIICDTVNLTYNPNGGVGYVRCYFVTDDSIMFLNFPVTWTSSDGLIYPGRTVWRDVFLLWDEIFDSLVVSQRLLRQVAWADMGGDDNPPLLTNGQRLRGMDLRFVIMPGAAPQFVWVDTCRDPINGSPEMAGPAGNYTFRPRFKKGYLRWGDVTDVEPIRSLPTAFALQQNYPNPFNPDTKIDFQIPAAGRVTLEIFNVLGQRVRTLVDEVRDAGFYTVTWDGRNDGGQVVPSGVYFYRMTAGDFAQTKKMIMVR